MPIFIDSSDLHEIDKYHRMGVIRGVTTNPTIMLREGVKGMDGIEKRARAIAKSVAPLPVSVEVTSNEAGRMVEQALLFSSWADNINVKITIHGPQGELKNVQVIHELESVHNVRVNVTAMMSAQQCFLAALTGATYVSIFGGRVNNMGYNACDEIDRLRKLLDRFRLEAKIVVGSTREVLNVVEWLDAGAHIVTVLPNLLEKMIVHPYSKETVAMFLQDGAKVEELIEAQAVPK